MQQYLNLKTDTISHFLPKDLLKYFTVTEILEKESTESKEPFFEIYLDEINTISLDIDTTQYESKGFSSVRLQDFPIRGKAVYLVIRRRVWRNKTNPKDMIKNKFPFVADGSRLTRELSDFLKDTSR